MHGYTTDVTDLFKIQIVTNTGIKFRKGCQSFVTTGTILPNNRRLSLMTQQRFLRKIFNLLTSKENSFYSVFCKLDRGEKRDFKITAVRKPYRWKKTLPLEKDVTARKPYRWKKTLPLEKNVTARKPCRWKKTLQLEKDVTAKKPYHWEKTLPIEKKKNLLLKKNTLPLEEKSYARSNKVPGLEYSSGSTKTTFSTEKKTTW